jgi:hypothetical protein
MVVLDRRERVRSSCARFPLTHDFLLVRKGTGHLFLRPVTGSASCAFPHDLM